MYQVTFSNQSILELNKLEPEIKLHLIDSLSNIQALDLDKATDIGHFQRDGTRFYRLRPKDFRIYFEIKDDEILFCHYILPQHTLSDFIFRFKLPVSEEQMLEQHQSFWKYLETLN